VARSGAVSAVKAEADRYAANVLPVIREAQKAGATTLRDSAKALNARGVATARGGQWHAKSISNILERVEGMAMHVADGTVLVMLATVFVAFEAIWPAAAVGGLGVWLLLH